ncbi:MAG: hypothetical protein WAX89_05375 [Alphaproteobacteria bacterium]
MQIIKLTLVCLVAAMPAYALEVSSAGRTDGVTEALSGEFSTKASTLLAQYMALVELMGMEQRKDMDCQLVGQAYNYTSNACQDDAVTVAEKACNRLSKHYGPSHPAADGSGCFQ